MKKMKMKMKGVAAKESSPYVVGEDPRTRLRHQSLLLDFEELQKETEAMKNKLQMMKQKKLTLSTEVRFLRKRYKYLITNQSPKPQPKQDFVQPQKFDTRNNGATKGKKYSKKEVALRHPVLVSDLNRKERIYNGGEATLRKPASIFDLNQKVRAFNGKEAALPTSAPKFDLNQKERIYSGKDAAKRNSTPVFDLNQISAAMIFLPSLSTREEWNNAVAATKVGVALTGSAAMGKIGPVVGPMDIGESDDSYFFRVSLPGVTRDEKDFSCEVEPDGKIVIKGVTTTGETIVCKNSQIFQMQSQNLCPPGHFSISFQLPGPVDNQQFSGSFGIDGILEGIVKKR